MIEIKYRKAHPDRKGGVGDFVDIGCPDKVIIKVDIEIMVSDVCFLGDNAVFCALWYSHNGLLVLLSTP